MGLFSTVLHLFKTPQAETTNELSAELRQRYGFSKFSRLNINNSNFKAIIDDEVEGHTGVFYLITQQHGNWTTIIELNVNLEEPFYLYELTNSLSKRLHTYALSFHLHDSDVLYYNLDKAGKSLDGYNSDYQYFLTKPASREEILSQRHTPQQFSPVLPAGKTTGGLNKILNEGYWMAFDNDELDKLETPEGDKYLIDEEDRFVRVGNYLEIYPQSDYPFANWYSNSSKLNLAECYLLKAEK
jgi:hypothetical protein